MSIIDRYNRIKNLLETSQQEKDEATGGLKQVLTEALKKYGCKTLPALEKKLTAVNTAVTQDEKAALKELNKLEAKWTDEL